MAPVHSKPLASSPPRRASLPRMCKYTKPLPRDHGLFDSSSDESDGPYSVEMNPPYDSDEDDNESTDSSSHVNALNINCLNCPREQLEHAYMLLRQRVVLQESAQASLDARHQEDLIAVKALQLASAEREAKAYKDIKSWVKKYSDECMKLVNGREQSIAAMRQLQCKMDLMDELLESVHQETHESLHLLELFAMIMERIMDYMPDSFFHPPDSDPEPDRATSTQA